MTRHFLNKRKQVHPQASGKARVIAVKHVDTSQDGKNSPKKEGSAPVDFDQLLHWIGAMGKWQILLFLRLSFLSIFTAIVYQGQIFIARTPDFRCAEDFPLNVSYRDIPETVSQCYRASGEPCRRWVFDVDFDGDGVADEATVVTKWNLVCSRLPMASALQSTIQAGGLFGSLVAGQLGDKFGRRSTFLGLSFTAITALIVSSVAGYYEVYIVLMFVIGFSWVGMSNTSAVLSVEVTVTEWRVAIGQMITFPYVIGQIVLAAVAYGVRIWWQLQLILAAPLVVHILDVFYFPESPLWLFHRGRDDEAVRALKWAARTNVKKLPEDGKLRSVLQLIRQREPAQAQQEVLQEDGILQGIRSSAKFRRWMLVSIICWTTIALTFFGLQFHVSKLSSNPYLASGLLGLAGVPSYLSPLLMRRFGKRPILIGALLVSGIFFLLFCVKRDPVFWLIIGIFTDLTLLGAWNILFYFTPEYIPTSIRNRGFGVVRASFQLGAVVSPFVLDSARAVNDILPSLIFGALCILAGLSAFFLPETMQRHLPETLAELEAGVLDLQVEKVVRDTN